MRDQTKRVAEALEPVLSRGVLVVLRIGFVLSAVAAGTLLTLVALALASGGWGSGNRAVAVTLLVLLVVDVLGCLAIIVFDFNLSAPRTRRFAQATVVAVLVALTLDIARNGLQVTQVCYIVQLLCVVSFQVATDQKLAHNESFVAPWTISDDPQRRSYIPLNFFNLFWVFTVASVAGLVVEVIFHALTVGGYEDRAGLLWGPFSPIYGFGATLMTIALNRWWNRSKIIIFLVAGFIGAAFEFVVSWILETAFGIVAWDYTGTFLNIDGRTNFAFFLAWGALGLVWIKLLLPDVLRLVDAIPLRIRAGLTVASALFMLVNGVMTLVTIDRWYERESGVVASNTIERFVDRHFDDGYMSHRFQSMNLDPDRATSRS